MENSSDDVSKIHNRYSLTLISPTSYYHSLILSVIVASLLTITTFLGYLESENFVFNLLAVVGVLLITQIIDSRIIRNKEYSKSLHTSLFGNIIWLLTALSGLLSAIILSKEETSLFFIVEGMFIFASFRIGLLTTVLGLRLAKAWLICFMQPLAMLVFLLPFDQWQPIFSDPMTWFFGVSFLVIATVWSKLTDRAGRPGVPSTHKLIQAYISSQGKDFSEIESMIEKRSKPSEVFTSQIRLKTDDSSSDFRLVLPDIHPGPYHPIGGSNIPYLIYKNLDSSAMVMHSVSDHTLNLPSKNQVENYLSRLRNASVLQEGASCTEPISVQINKSRAVGILFEKTAILFLSLSPHGMEDLPYYVEKEIEQYAKNRKFDRVMVVDTHNAMGEEISEEDSEDLLQAAKSCLDTLITKDNFPLKFGYANSSEMTLSSPDLGLGGLGVLCLQINGANYFLGWADSNNMENGLREEVVDQFRKNGLNLIEICTSDTHYAQKNVRNKNGYYQFGAITDFKKIANWYLEIAKKAEAKILPAKIEILENKTDVKVMGPKIFEDYSKALDSSLKLTKGFMLGSLALFFASLIL